MLMQFTHTYQHITSLENLLEAWKEFIVGKRKRKDVQEFERNLMHNIIALHRYLGLLNHGNWKKLESQLKNQFYPRKNMVYHEPMIIDGKQLADEIRQELKKRVRESGIKMRLAVIAVGASRATEQFMAQKKKLGESIGTDVRIYDFPETITTNALRKKIAEIVHIKENTAVIVQLPLPSHIKVDYILDAIPISKDADVLSSKAMGLFAAGRGSVIPPVAGAVAHILQKNEINIKGQHAVVVGAGRLVGRPVALWLMNQGVTVTICDEHTRDIKSHTTNADIIISGVGHANLITPDMVKDGVVAIDAGASESHGKIIGDMDPAIAEKALLFTPVPGGVGPLTIAMLFQNIFLLSKNKSPKRA